MDEIIQHQYRPLEPGAIRLMKLEPAINPNAPLIIEFVLEHISNIAGQYEAISYAWGNPELIRPVYLKDGSTICVTSNLDLALRRLRWSQVFRMLWADALCIDQTNLQEKADQIPMMVDIFRAARHVVAWLGPGGIETNEEQGLRIMEALSRQSRIDLESDRQIGHSSESAWGFPLSEDRGHTRSINSFLRQSWWTRLWVIQEVVFNIDVTFMCGASKITWIRLRAALTRLPRTVLWDDTGKHRLDKQKIKAVVYIGDLWYYHSILCAEPNPNVEPKPDSRNKDAIQTGSILQMLDVLHDYRYTDPRDYIFAIYSMAPDILPCSQRNTSKNPNTIFMDITYELDVEQTYEAFATACIEARRLESLLEAVLSRLHGSRQSTFGVQTLRSWVPDWRKSPSSDYNSISFYDWHVEISSSCCFVTAANKNDHPTIRIKSPTTMDLGSDASMLDLKNQFSWHGHGLRDMLASILPKEYRTVSGSCNLGEISVRNCPVKLWVPKSKVSVAREQIADCLRPYCFFVAQEGSAGILYLGFGSADLDIGDMLVPSRDRWGAHCGALVLRKTKSIDKQCAGRDSVRHYYRLGGVASVLPILSFGPGQYAAPAIEGRPATSKTFWLE